MTRRSHKNKSAGSKRQRGDEFVSPLVSSLGTRRFVRESSVGKQRAKRRQNRRRSASSVIRARARSFATTARPYWVGTGLIVSICAGLVYAHHWAREHRVFAMQEVEVEGLERAERDTVVGLGGLSLGIDLLDVDTSEAEAGIERHPWIKEAKVRRVFPSRVKVTVTEHHPVALVSLGHLYYADGEGEIVKRRAPEETEFFPIITGFEQKEIEDSPEARQRLHEVVHFIGELESTMSEDGVRIEQAHFDRNLGLTFIPEGKAMTVKVGTPPWSDGIAQFARVYRGLKERGISASQITLGGDRRPDRVVAQVRVAANQR